MKNKVQLTPENALTRLQDLCSRSERSEGELREKMWQWGIKPEDATKIIVRLREDKFVDDRRFASAYCRQKLFFSHWGKKKIALSLAAKRVDRAIISGNARRNRPGRLSGYIARDYAYARTPD